MTETDRLKAREVDLHEHAAALNGYWANGRWHSEAPAPCALARMGSTPDAWTVIETRTDD